MQTRKKSVKDDVAGLHYNAQSAHNPRNTPVLQHHTQKHRGFTWFQPKWQRVDEYPGMV